MSPPGFPTCGGNGPEQRGTDPVDHGSGELIGSLDDLVPAVGSLHRVIADADPEHGRSVVLRKMHRLGQRADGAASHPVCQDHQNPGGNVAGGEALRRLIVARPRPIPYYAEMSSINPVVLLPGALRRNGDTIATGLYQSVTLGVGQFCTNPGLVVVPEGKAAEAFADEVVRLYSDESRWRSISDAAIRNVEEHFSLAAARSSIENLLASLKKAD